MSRRIFRWIRNILIVAVMLLVLSAAALVVWYQIAIVRRPGPEISREHIQKIFNLESPVYYDDGETVLGVFFQEEHRSYVPYERLPDFFIKAVIASEDKNFFSHPGFDIAGILRAVYLNLRAGRVVQGGSTITQQTAKNIFKRQKRSMKAKLVELIHALKLEAHYSKEQILEWYANQFYVSGNGRGVGIAAQYFFDKPVEELGLLECAFLAGCVKAPNRYNPFIQKTDWGRKQTIRRARRRTNYVLKNMLELGFISSEQYEEAIDREIPFKQGKIRYPLNVILDEVRERLSEPHIQQALLQAGVENIATSGIRIHTSINKGLQEAALQALRSDLSTLETSLSGYDRETLVERYNRILESGDRIERDGFAFGRVTRVATVGGALRIDVELPGGEIGRVDKRGIQRLVSSLAKNRHGQWAQPTEEDEKLLLEQIREGDPVFVRLDGRSEQGVPLLDMEQYPELNGGVLVVQDGFIKAMVGGVDNIHFNRAMDAKRQVGSVFKPVVFLGALQLGWSNLDPLRNRRHAFLYNGRIYIPRPDHVSPDEWVSMTWAGAKSENVATVWLLYHLCDKLTPAQIRELAGVLDMAQRPGESRVHYIRRIRDEMGIQVNDDALRQTAFEEARAELRTDLIFKGRTDELRALDDLHYGLGVERYLEDRQWTPESLFDPELKEEEREELRILFQNYLRLWALREEMMEDYQMLRWTLLQYDPYTGVNEQLGESKRFYWVAGTEGKRLIYAKSPGEDRVPLNIGWVLSRMQEGWDLDQIIPYSEIWVDGALPAGILDQLHEGMEARVKTLRAADPYSLEVLGRVRDFKVALALRYVVHLAHRLGVRSDLEPVLSFPLGANSITMEDASLMYYGLVTGRGFFQGEYGRRPKTFLITRIEGPEGEVLYEAKPRSEAILAPQQSNLVSDILRSVILFGTGRKARKAVSLAGSRKEGLLKKLQIAVPVLGKTGTSDEFRNSSFVGFVPGIDAERSVMELKKGVVLAAYVGYDDNRSMKNERIRIFGASGALPIWIRVARAAVEHLHYEEHLDLVDLSFRPESVLPIKWPTDWIEIPVDPGSGLPRPGGRSGPRVHTYGALKGRKLALKRFFEPLEGAEE